MRSLDGANCADLPAFVVDKYFNCDASVQRFRKQVALAICGNCSVLEACRDEAMTGADPPRTGVIAGTTANQIAAARAWRNFEQGVVDTPPARYNRPTWLPITDAGHTVEQTRVEEDPDEGSEL